MNRQVYFAIAAGLVIALSFAFAVFLMKAAPVARNSPVDECVAQLNSLKRRNHEEQIRYVQRLGACLKRKGVNSGVSTGEITGTTTTVPPR